MHDKLFSYESELPKEANKLPDYSTLDISEFQFTPPPMARFREIIDRPLFTPTRRQAVSIGPSPTEIFLLRGVVLSRRHNTALVERRSDGVLLRMREGDRVDGWRLRSIDEDAIEFSGSKENYVIKMAGHIEDDGLTSEEEHRIDDVGAGEKQSDPSLGIAVSGGQASRGRLPTRSDAQADERRNVAYPTVVPGELPPPPPRLLPRLNRTRRS